MKLVDLVRPSQLEAGIRDGLIASRVHPDDADTAILNYTDKAVYTAGAWDNPAVRQCRGLIVRDGNVIARPWAKFFNHGQAEAGQLDLTAPVEVTDKVDGSLGIIYPQRDGGYAVATRGSFTSTQALHATAMLRRMLEDDPEMRWPEWLTPLVEIVYPDNRVVVDYGDRDELVLLGGVTTETGTYHGPAVTAFLMGWTGAKTQTFECPTLGDALAAEPRPNAEGLCVRYLTIPRIVKIKQADYVELHRIVTGLSERSVWQHMADGGTLEDLLAPLPDELQAWTRSVWNTLSAAADSIASYAQDVHDEMVAYQLDPSFTRGEYAAIAKTHESLAPYLFALLDGIDLYPRIVKSLKPSGATRARTFTEETA